MLVAPIAASASEEAMKKKAAKSKAKKKPAKRSYGKMRGKKC